jgi:hypothetical protein
VSANGLPLGLFESRRLSKDVHRYGAFAYIVKHPGEYHLPEKIHGKLENQAESEPDDGDVHGMVESVLVIGFDTGKTKNQSGSQEYLIHQGR